MKVPLSIQFSGWIALGLIMIAGFLLASETICFAPLEGSKRDQSSRETNNWPGTLGQLIDEPILRDIALSNPQQTDTESHNDAPNQKVSQANPYPLICDAKITDLGIMFFTYCLVVVGWFTLKSNERTLQDIEGARIFVAENINYKRTPNAIPDTGDIVKVQFALKNHGKTLAILTKIEAEVRIVTELPTEIRKSAVELPPGLTIGSGETTPYIGCLNLVVKDNRDQEK
jgi:hypothetical protein